MAGLRKACFAAVLILSPAMVCGQAWTPPAGHGTVWISVQRLHTDAHLQGSGVTAGDIDVRANTLMLGVDYGLTDRFALAFSVPYVGTRLVRGNAHAGAIVDDGRTHGTATDLHIDLRYKAIDSTIVVTPTLSAVFPTRDYPTLGHAAPGRGLREYAAGFEAGHHAISISPSLFLSGSFQYTYVERIDDHITVDRSNADIQADYLLTDRWALRAAAYWQKTHGGLDLPLAPHERAEHGHHHDQLARANFWHGSVGVAYALTPTVDLFGSWSTVLEGVNTHRFRSWGGGIAWRFDRSK